uniref:Uncharacterized protein n=1 Tax=Anguilla anguilla TaxID=7936 RepID=A0A0E9PTT6_ANGAN
MKGIGVQELGMEDIMLQGSHLEQDKIMLLKSHWEWMVLKCSCCFRNACLKS